MTLERSLLALAENRTTSELAPMLAAEMRATTQAHCIWVLRNVADDSISSLALDGSGAVAQALENPRDADHAPARTLLVGALASTGDDYALLAADESLQHWGEALRADGIDAVGCQAAPGGLADRLAVIRFGGVPLDPAGQDTLAAVLSALARQERQTLLEMALDQAGNSVFLTDGQGSIVWANAAFTRLTGFEAQEVLGKNPRILKSGLQSRRYYRKLWSAIGSGRVWTAEAVDRDKFGYNYAIHQTISPVRRDNTRLAYLSIHDDVSRKLRWRAEAERHRHEDWRSGLLTATSFRDELFARLRSAEQRGHEFVVLSCVLTNFDTVLESLDPELGDVLVAHIGKCIRAGLGPGDQAGAMSEGEYGLILDGVADDDSVTRRMQDLAQKLRQPIPLIGDTLHLRLRYGLAAFPADATEADQLWRLADDALLDQD